MNTTKKLCVLCLAALMGVISFIPSTFSWYTHSDTQEGDAARYQRSNLSVSNGAVTMKTVQYVQETNGDVKYDSDKKKVIKDGNPVFSVPADAPGNTYYYRTTFTNSGDVTAFAGFYLNNITNSSNVFVGNNYPTISEKATGYPTRVRSAYSKTRLYFNPNSATGWTGTGNSKFYLVYKTSSSSFSAVQMTATTPTHSYYYINLPVENVSEFFFAKGSNTTEAISADSFKRTKTFTKATPSTLYTLTGNITNDDNNYAACSTEVKSEALGVTEYYKSVTTTVGQQFYFDLPGKYTAQSVSYQVKNSSDSSKITVDSKTGSATVNNSSLSTNPGVKAVLTGAWGDTMDVETAINVPTEVDNIPVCQNIKIGVGESVDIEWYITNKTSSATSTFSIYSTI